MGRGAGGVSAGHRPAAVTTWLDWTLLVVDALLFAAPCLLLAWNWVGHLIGG